MANKDFRVKNDLQVGGAISVHTTDATGKPTISGSRGGNAALASLLTALDQMGLIEDSTTA